VGTNHRKTLAIALLAAILPSWTAVAQSSLTVVSAADYIGYYPFSPNSIVSMFAANIAAGVVVATDPPPAPLPTSLGGVSATITDSSGNTLPIGLIAVTPGQVNAVLPGGITLGNATVNLITSSGIHLSSGISIDSVGPSLFTADQTGGWLPAADVVVVHVNGSQTFLGPVAKCGSSLVWNGATWSDCVPVPINVGSPTDQVVLELFGTGIRGASPGSTVVNVCTGMSLMITPAYLFEGCAESIGPGLTILYAGPQGGGAPGSFYGLDQVNVVLPQSLAGSGILSVVVSVGDNFEEDSSNTVILGIQ
jgi:uncharacterized protein (TIGR03437 family)